MNIANRVLKVLEKVVVVYMSKRGYVVATIIMGLMTILCRVFDLRIGFLVCLTVVILLLVVISNYGKGLNVALIIGVVLFIGFSVFAIVCFEFIP